MEMTIEPPTSITPQVGSDPQLSHRSGINEELTFQPKLNAQSLKILGHRGMGGGRRNSRSSFDAGDIDRDVFTFKPRVSLTSSKIAESLGTTFMDRQEKHIEKQKKLLEQSPLFSMPESPPRGRLSPVQSKVTKPGHKPTKDSNTMSVDESVSPRSNVSEGITTSTTTTTTTSKATQHLDQTHSTQQQQQQQKISNTTAASAGLNNKKQISLSHGSLNRIEGSRPAPTQRQKTDMNGLSLMTGERLKQAKAMADDAQKNHRVFVIQGTYPTVRHSLKKRQWVEKIYQKPTKPEKKHKKPQEDSDSSSDSDSDDDDRISPAGDSLQDPNGVAGIMSRLLRNVTPTFVWTVRTGAIDYKYLKRDVIVNHYSHAGTLTTKVGLSNNMKQLHWFVDVDPDTIYPRCYLLCSDSEKEAFIEDFRLGACIGLLKTVVDKYIIPPESADGGTEAEQNPTSSSSDENKENNDNLTADQTKVTEEAQGQDDGVTEQGTASRPTSTKNPQKQIKKVVTVSSSVIHTALTGCEMFLESRSHSDIDNPIDAVPRISADQWNEFLQQYYKVVHDGAIIDNALSFLASCESTLDKITTHCPQHSIQGSRNIWIVKPGAKSRGRGIQCLKYLHDILALVSPSVCVGKNERKLVIQKYIERPLLVYTTKFDIRQWFLVTDWNPLTVWFYRDCYLRFCSQEFSLKDLHESVHLSNNSIQCHYRNCIRAPQLPNDNMWTCKTFNNYLRGLGKGEVWTEKIYPGMKSAVIGSVLVAQDHVDNRKNSFELFGADFMLDEELNPWLIEINSSPAMGPSTQITADMCACVLEDTLKVVLDRKEDRTCDIGKYELALKMPAASVPHYIGMNLSVDGTAIPRPNALGGVTGPRRVSLPNNITASNIIIKPSNTRTSNLQTVIENSTTASQSNRLNSLNKTYNETERHQGSRSMQLRRQSNKPVIQRSQSTLNKLSQETSQSQEIAVKSTPLLKSTPERLTILPTATGKPTAVELGFTGWNHKLSTVLCGVNNSTTTNPTTGPSVTSSKSYCIPGNGPGPKPTFPVYTIIPADKTTSLTTSRGHNDALDSLPPFWSKNNQIRRSKTFVKGSLGFSTKTHTNRLIQLEHTVKHPTGVKGIPMGIRSRTVLKFSSSDERNKSVSIWK